MGGVRILNDSKYTTVRLRNMAVRAENLYPIWPRVERFIRSEVRKQFLSGGAYFGSQAVHGATSAGPWKPLKASTIADRRRSGIRQTKPLIRSGALMKQFTKNPMNSVVLTKRTGDFGSKTDLARWQSGGTKRNGKRHIPSRRILYRTPSLERGIAKIMRQHVVGRKPKVD